MQDITAHKLFVPAASVASMVVTAITMTWVVASYANKIDVRLAVLETLMSQHLKQNNTALLWTEGDTP